MAGTAIAGLPETPATVGEKTRRTGAVMLQDGQTLMPGTKSSAVKQPMNRAGSYPDRASCQLQRQPPRSPRRPGQSHAQDGLFLVRFHLRRPPAPAPPPARVQPSPTVLRQLPFQR